MTKPVFEERNDVEKGFAAHFDTYIAPLLDDIEKERLKQKKIWEKRKKIAFKACIASLILFMLFNIFFMSESIFEGIVFFIVGSFFIILGWYGWSYKPYMQFTGHYKEKILPHIITFFGPFTYDPKGKIDPKRLEIFDLLPYYTKYESEDLFQGNYRDIEIEIAETRLERKGSRNSSVRIFDGLFILLKMNKEFKSQTILLKDRGSVLNWLQNKATKFENIKLEDPRFESLFEVYGTDQIEARYLLTTAFMERLLQLSKLFNNAKLQASFVKDQLFIMIPAYNLHNFFEASGLEKSVYQTDKIRFLLKEIHSVLKIIDVLKLNKKLGL